MADVILFHHALGLTEGVRSFADRLQVAGHRVSVPDFYRGAIFTTVEEGVTHAEEIGFDNILGAATTAAEELPADLVYAGFSLGALCAHKLAQTRPGARGALLYHHGDVPLTTFGQSWPDGVDFQLHVNEKDEFCELEVVEEFVELAAAHAQAELFTYPGSSHLFTDPSLADYEPDSAEKVMARSLAFLASRG